MKIPVNVRIGGVDYEVRYVENLNNDRIVEYGRIEYDKALISINNNLQDRQGRCQTFLHEVLHGIARHFELDVGYDEDTIDKLAKGLYMVIKDNPEIFR